MTYKIPMYYVVKVQEGYSASYSIVKDVEYLAGPFGSYSDELMEAKCKFEDSNYNKNSYVTIATQYIEVEL